MVYNGYYKVMSNIPKMGHLPTPVHGDELTNDGSVLCLIIHQARSVFFFVSHCFLCDHSI